MISDRKRFVFVHIPRTAGTSVETALAPYARTPIGFTVNDCTVLPDKHATAATLRALVGPAFWEQAFTFSIVRDPWARMHSDYHFFRDVGPRLMPAFSELERWLCDLALTTDFPTWLHRGADRLDIAQWSYLAAPDGACLIDDIARFETIDRDFARICATLGVEHALPRVNATRHGDHRAAYTPEAITLVARYAADDLHHFGYRFQP
ncbi:MAG: sulfotransferase family 2 domain-containing protein [bacterium]